MRPLLTLWLLLFALGERPLIAQGSASLRARLLRAEDRRAPGKADLLLLEAGLHHPDSAVVLQAIRALGRLERPSLAAPLIPLLGHASPGVRTRAADAVAQAAQGFRGDTSLAHRGAPWGEIVAALSKRAALERDPGVAGALALSLGRLPYLIASEAAAAREQLLELDRATSGDLDAGRRVARAMETLARGTARRFSLDSGLVARLRALGAAAPDERTRRHALGALLAAQAADSGTVAAMLASGDPETRRLALTGLAAVPAGPGRERLLAAALPDNTPMVRLEALRALARLSGAAACARLIAAAADPVASVSLMAIDLLGACPGDPAAVALLAAAVSPVAGAAWRLPAHALVSLARTAPDRARDAVRRAEALPAWQSRMYAARAAALTRDREVLLGLAADRVPNVREAAIAGLATVSGHTADSVYRAALSATDYQLLLGAAAALAGSPERDQASTALRSALDRTTRERRETSRDSRVALLTRLHELGDARSAPALLPLLRDFDPVIAESAAVTLAGWSGRAYHPAPRPLLPVPVTLAEVEELRGKVFRFTMDSGRFEVELYPDVAPVTVARLARLVRRRYYDGLTLHREVPNFVLQGGSPGANEYMGDGPFMRDELGPLSHERWTLGVSTRGRDTGDGQLFINLVDNPRLDFEYTVWGRVVSGREVVQAIHEGAVIRRVEIRPR